jgi:phosphatidylserine/phosphatidylglycerophosphate/cardiolipin synthase-like enzyme
VKANPDLKVIILLAKELEFTGPMRVAHHEMRNEALNAVIGKSVGQVFVYTLEQTSSAHEPIYVHSKLTLIDDRYAGVGSVNVNKRSHTTDSELHLSVVDADIVQGTIDGKPASVCRFAKELRIALWGEHLGIKDPAKLEDPIAALSEWPSVTGKSPVRVNHVVPYKMKTETATLLEWLGLMKALRDATTLPPPWDKWIDLDDIIETIEETLRTLGTTPAELALGPLYFLLKKFMKEFLMNLETTCP